jgi:hypothetical protein
MLTPRVNSDGDHVIFDGERDTISLVRAELKAWGLRINYNKGFWRGTLRLPPHWVLQSAKRYARDPITLSHKRILPVWGRHTAIQVGSLVCCCRAAVELITLEGSDG